MSQWIKTIFLSLSIAGVTGCATGGFRSFEQAATIDLGNPASEKRNNVTVENAPAVGEDHPDYWLMAVRASAYEEGCEPWRVLDGDSATNWRVSGQPPHPMAGGHWIDLEHNRTRAVDEISIRWLGDEPYEFIVYEHAWSDATNIRRVYQGISAGREGELETYRFNRPVKTRTLRIEFVGEGDDEEEKRGIKEVRIGGLEWPAGYPPAAYEDAPVVSMERPMYVEFERFLLWHQFNLKRPLADGGTARRIMNTDDFEGGHIDFDIAVAPRENNWITLKLWESEETVRNDNIALEALHHDPERNRRWFLSDYTTEKENRHHEWYGLKPRPGRWVYHHYELPEDIVGEQSLIRLRLQGIGNDRRDHPMRSPTPPIYKIYSGRFFPVE